MAKCGKGCMPECEYFTTGGCISPFNCPYKIETGYINSATSITDSLTGLLMEFDEMGLLRQRRAPDPEKYAIEWREKVWAEVKQTAKERERLKIELRQKIDYIREQDEIINIYRRAIENLSYKRAKTLLNDDSKEAMEKIKFVELQQAEKEIAEEK